LCGNFFLFCLAQCGGGKQHAKAHCSKVKEVHGYTLVLLSEALFMAK